MTRLADVGGCGSEVDMLDRETGIGHVDGSSLAVGVLRLHRIRNSSPEDLKFKKQERKN